MKNQIFSTLMTGCLLVLMMVVPARAQVPGTAMHAIIPFDFIVRGKTLPAGKYEIRRISDSPEGLVIRSVVDRHDNVVFETGPVEARTVPEKSLIIFHRYGDSYFLSEIFTAGDQAGRELAPSSAERQLRREMASNKKEEPETVSLAVY